MLLSNWFPMVVELRTTFKRRSLGKIKGSCTIRCILDTQLLSNKFLKVFNSFESPCAYISQYIIVHNTMCKSILLILINLHMVGVYWDIYVCVCVCVCVCVINCTMGMNPLNSFFLLILHSLGILLYIISPNSL